MYTVTLFLCRSLEVIGSHSTHTGKGTTVSFYLLINVKIALYVDDIIHSSKTFNTVLFLIQNACLTFAQIIQLYKS